MELKTPPLFWIGPELTKLNGNSPVLSDKQVRQANAGAGLNSVTWVGAFDTDHWQSVEAHSAMFAAFVGEHQGFLLKELVGFGMSVEALEGTLRSGALLLSPVDGRYVDSVDRPLQEIFAKPHLVGLTRELAMARIRTWVGSLFVYHPPQFAFRPSEQRPAARRSARRNRRGSCRRTGDLALCREEDLAVDLRSRRRYRSGLIPDHATEELTSERGKEKKHRLLVYLREHPEELRPATL